MRALRKNFLQYQLTAAMALVWLMSAGFMSPATKLCSKAMRFAKAGQNDFAYMQYHQLLRDYPDSKYRAQALFATGEYYYQTASFYKAAEAFQMFLNENPDSRERPYALAYLLNLSEKKKFPQPAEELRREIIDLQQVSLVFREAKEITYRSPMNQQYKIVIYIDRIEFFLEGDLFAKVSF